MTPTSETFRQCTVEEWEKKAELALLNGDLGEGMKFAHYANMQEQDPETDQGGDGA